MPAFASLAAAAPGDISGQKQQQSWELPAVFGVATTGEGVVWKAGGGASGRRRGSSWLGYRASIMCP